MPCDAKIRPMPNETELQCELDHSEVTPKTKHVSTLKDYAYKGSSTEIHWFEEDRRTFRGDWMECPQRACVLPAGHPRKHAVT